MDAPHAVHVSPDGAASQARSDQQPQLLASKGQAITRVWGRYYPHVSDAHTALTPALLEAVLHRVGCQRPASIGQSTAAISLHQAISDARVPGAVAQARVKAGAALRMGAAAQHVHGCAQCRPGQACRTAVNMCEGMAAASMAIVALGNMRSAAKVREPAVQERVGRAPLLIESLWLHQPA